MIELNEMKRESRIKVFVKKTRFEPRQINQKFLTKAAEKSPILLYLSLYYEVLMVIALDAI